MVLLFEANGTIRYINPSVKKVLGYNPEEIIGSEAFEHVHPEDLKQAKRTFARVLRSPGDQAILEPDNPEAWYNKGMALYRLERYEEAVSSYEEALRLRPDDPEAWYNKGIALSDLERVDEAIQALCIALHAWERHPDYRLLVAEAIKELGYDPEQCEQRFPPAPTSA